MSQLLEQLTLLTQKKAQTLAAAAVAEEHATSYDNEARDWQIDASRPCYPATQECFNTRLKSRQISAERSALSITSKKNAESLRQEAAEIQQQINTLNAQLGEQSKIDLKLADQGIDGASLRVKSQAEAEALTIASVSETQISADAAKKRNLLIYGGIAATLVVVGYLLIKKFR